MLEFRTGDILGAAAEALVNAVNCVGVMGRGLALQFRKAFQENDRAYRAACEREEVRPGSMFVYDLGQDTPPHYVINFPTKRHWRGKSRLGDIRTGLAALVAEVRKRDIRSVAIPPLGCGLGGLNWSDVRPLIEAAFRDLPDVTVQVYEPAGAPAAARVTRRRRPGGRGAGPR